MSDQIDKVLSQFQDYVCVDLGQVQDYTAIMNLNEEVYYDRVTHRDQVKYTVNHMERHREISYPDICVKIANLMLHPKLNNPILLVDQTGVGRPVVDLLRKNDLSPIGITITGGHTYTLTGEGDYHVPKKELVSALISLAQSGRLKLIRSLPETEVLMKEMENFRVKVSARTGEESFEAWREQEHDDLVIALSMGAWFATQGSYEKSVTPSQMYKNDMEENANYNPLWDGMERN